MAKVDYKNNFFRNDFQIHLPKKVEKKEFLEHLKMIIDSSNDFYGKLFEIEGLISCVVIEGLEPVFEDKPIPFYIDRPFLKDTD